MTKVITNETAVAEARARIVELVTAMLSGEVCFLEGSWQLFSLRHCAAISDHDPDFNVFVAIASETDHLPIGSTQENWSSSALERHQPQVEAASKWAREISPEACNSILRRFSA